MEHLFTSFFRSTAAGSFKEHRMVFQTVTPGRIESVAVAEQRQKEMVDRLNNPNDVQAAADARVLSISLALSRDLDTRRIDTAKDALDARIKAREEAERDVGALKTEHDAFRKTEGAALTAAVGPARNPIVEKLFKGPTPPNNRGSIVEAMGKIRDLSNTPAASRGLMQDKLIAQYRDHVRELQNLPALDPQEKAKLNNPFSSEIAADVPGKERLGKAYLAAEPGVDTSVANTFRFNKTIAGTNVDVKFVWNVNKWTIESTAPAVAVADVVAATDTFEQAPFNAAPWNVPTSEHNTERLRLKTILTNLKTGVVDPTLGGLTTVQNIANAAEATRANDAVSAARKTHGDFLGNDTDAGWSGLVRRLRSAERDNLTDAVRGRKDDIRALGNTRKQEIYTAIAALNTSAATDTAIKSSKYVDHMNVLVEQLADIDQRVAKLTAAPTTAPVTPPAGVDSLPVAERAPVEAFNNFLRDNAVVNALTDVETTRKPAIDAIVAQLPTLTTDGQRKLGRAAVEAKMTAKGYTVTALEFSPARLEIRRTAEAAPVTPEITTFLGTETERNTLRDALRTNVATPDALPVRNAITAFQGRLAAVPEGQRAAAVARLNETVRVPATATTDGLEIAINGTNLEARRINRAGTTLPPAPERKERAERMSEFMKILIELIRALLQIEQQRTTVMARGVEAQMKLAAQIEAQMKALPPAGRRDPTQEQQFNKMRNDLNRVQGELATFRKQREESIAKANAAIARRPNNTLVVEADADIRRPVRVCVRRGVNLADAGVSARVSADINFVRADSGLPLVATTSPSAAAPTRVVPTTAFYVGSVNIDNRATTTATITNSPGARIDASSTARTDVTPPAPRVTPVVRTDAPPPPPRVTGTGRPNPGSLNG